MNNPILNSYKEYKKKYGVNITKNNINYKVVIKDTSDSLINKIKIDSNIIKYGDYISYNSKTYLIDAFVTPKIIYDEFDMQLCNNSLRYKASIDGVEGVISIPAIIEKGTISLDTGQITTIDNELSCSVGYSEIDKIKYITVGFRFIINGNVWEVKGIDNVSSMLKQEEGIIFIKLSSTQKGAEDNLTTGLAYNAVIPVIVTPHVYLIQAESIKPIENTRTSQVTLICSKDGILDNSPTLTYTSNDMNICTVDNLGKINAVGVGSTNIIAKYQDVSISIYINVIEKVEIYTLIGSDSINEAVSQNYKIIDEAGLDSALEYTFSVDNNSLVTIESFGTNYVNIKGTNIEGSIVLTVTNKIDTSKVYTKVINTLFNAHTYTINATETNVSINKAETHQLVVSCTDNGVIINSPIVTYISNNEAIATVNASGIVTGVSGGNCIITVSFIANNGVTYSSTVNIEVIVASVTTYDITSSSGLWIIKKTTTITYTGIRYLNGVIDTSATFNFTLDYNGLPTSAVTFTIFDSKTAKLKSNVDVGTVILRATNTVSGAYVEKTILLKNIYGN